LENEVVKFTRETTLELAKLQREKMLQRAIIFAGTLTEKAFSEIEKNAITTTNISGSNGKEKESLEAVVTTILAGKLNALLKDCTWRIQQAVNKDGKIPAERIDSKKHQLTGFTITDNSPIAGKIAWASCHIVYQGADVTIDDGNTDLKYVWWDYSAEPNTVFQVTDAKPTLTDDDVLVFVNENGTHHTIMSQMPPGAFLLGTSISPLELGANAVITTKILDANVTEGKLDDGSVTHLKLGADAVEAGNIKDGEVGSAEIAALAILEGKIAAGAVTVNKIGDLAVSEAKLAAGAVTVTKIGDLAVTEDKLGAGAVTVTKIGDLAVTEAKIGALAVTEGKIGALAVTEGKLDSGAVTHTKMGADAIEADNIKDGEVDTAELAPGAVTNAKIEDGVIAATKLNLLSHLIY